MDPKGKGGQIILEEFPPFYRIYFHYPNITDLALTSPVSDHEDYQSSFKKFLISLNHSNDFSLNIYSEEILKSYSNPSPSLLAEIS